MLDPKLLRDKPDWVATQLAKRNFTLDVEQFNALEAERKALQVSTQEWQHQRKTLSKSIGQAKAKGESVDAILKQVDAMATQLQDGEKKLADIQQSLSNLVMALPNIPADDVPEGHSEDDNVLVRQWGEVKDLSFEPVDHVTLGENLAKASGQHTRGLDFEQAAKVTGSRFSVLAGSTARLHRALAQFMLDLHTQEHGYTELYVPYIVNADSLRGTGQLPKFEEDLFKIHHQEGDANQDFYLIPTAEVPVTNLWRDSILEETQLPCRYVAHTPCFRSEAGSYGRDTRGLIRQHQFDKIELVQCVRPEDSWQALESLVHHAEEVLKRLQIPYRVVNLCAGDLGFSAAKTYDIEAWIPSQKQYREISSCSNFLDFQARRMKARWRSTSQKKPALVHTLNGSALAVGRTLLAVMENYQDEDGKVRIPEVLRPYMGGNDTL